MKETFRGADKKYEPSVITNTSTPKTDEVEEIVKRAEYLGSPYAENLSDKERLVALIHLVQLIPGLVVSLHQSQEEEKKALAHAIMTVAHEKQVDDGTPYPKISTHALAREIKKLIPDFNYYGYIKRWAGDDKNK